MGLKSCPCCGSSRAPRVQVKYSISLYELYLVKCGFTQGGCGIQTSCYNTAEQAVTAWNRRAKSKPYSCTHDKEYLSGVLATSKPPKRPWVCTKCGATGYDPICEDGVCKI